MAEEILIRTVVIRNPLGLHARPATLIVQRLQDLKSQVFFTHQEQTIDANSILNILVLGAEQGTHITIRTEGEDAKEAMDCLIAMFESSFGEA